MADAVAEGAAVAKERKAEEAAVAERQAKEKETTEKTDDAGESEQVKIKKKPKKTLGKKILKKLRM